MTDKKFKFSTLRVVTEIIISGPKTILNEKKYTDITGRLKPRSSPVLCSQV